MSSITLRLLTLDDAPVLAELLRVNRDFLTPWEPIRGEEYFTVDGQHANIRDALERHGHGSALPLAILDDAARVIGRITLDGIARGPFQSGNLGYWGQHRRQWSRPGEGGVFVMYEYELETGERCRNTGFIPVRDGRLAGTQVFFGGRVA
jgi:RimJ/RimL family protein N-acetyltransferase